MVGSHKRLTGIVKIVYVSLPSRKRCVWETWVLTDAIQAVKWRILVLSTGQGSWRTQAQVLDSALRALEAFVCAYQLLLKLFFEFEGVSSCLWKCHMYLYLEELWCSSLWAGWSWIAAVAVNSYELTPTRSGAGSRGSHGWVRGNPLAVPCCAWGAQHLQKGVTRGGGGVEGEGCGGSQQKLTSRKLFPLQPISGRSLLTYVFPFTLQYVCQRAIAPLTWTLLFMPSLFAHFNPVLFITAHPSPSLSSTSDSYFLICLVFSPFIFFCFPLLPPSEFPHHLSPLSWLLSSIFPPHPFSCSFFLRSHWAKGHPHTERDALFGVTSLSLISFLHIWGPRSIESPFFL